MNEKKILLIEDEPDTVAIYKNQLTRDGYDFLSASTADQGLILIKEERPALILLDLMLPGKSGFDILDAVQKDPYIKSIPVLALTNLAEEVGLERALSRGAFGYMIKAGRTPRQVSLLIKQILAEHKKEFR